MPGEGNPMWFASTLPPFIGMTQLVALAGMLMALFPH
jgi:hypothetical protein